MHEIRPWIGKPPITEPPDIPGHRLVRGEQLDLVRASILGVLLVPVWWLLFFIVVPLLNGGEEFAVTISIVDVLVGLIFAAGLIVIHELIHGLAILASGNRPAFGAGPGFFYTTCHQPLTRNAYISVALLPLIVINGSAIVIAGIWPGATGWMLFLSILSTMGAGGDIWMFLRLIKIPRLALIFDLASGFAVYYPDQATAANPVES